VLSKIDRLKAQIRDNLRAAQGVADQATHRDFTADETRFIEERLAEAKRLGPELERAKQHDSDEQVRAAARQLNAEVGLVPDPGGFGTSSSPAPLSPHVKALGGSDWGEKIVRTAASDHFGRFKALAPSGQVNVSIPLAPEVVRDGEPVLSLRQLIPAEQDLTGAWSYLRQTLRQQNAAVVPAGAKKPESLYTLARQEGRSVTIAHLSEPIARQDIADALLLTEFIDREMRLGVETALENEIINGDGSGDRLTGLNFTSGTMAQPFSGSAIQTARKALTALENQSLQPTGWVMAPSTWEAVELDANAGGFTMAAAGQGVPVEAASRRLWGVPVVVSTSVAPNVAWLADWAGSTTLKIREDIAFSWSENMYDADALGAGVGASDFERNLIRFRCEGRFGFAVTRPSGAVKVTMAA